MIKFFRKIRQKSLTENKISKPASRMGRYLIYAIGEIVLVVIGILIALQVNNWNEQRKSNTGEKVFIKNLVIDLKSDVVSLDEVITYNEEKLVLIDSLLTFVNKNINELQNHDELYRYAMSSLYTNWQFKNQNRTLNTLSNQESGIIRQNVADSIAVFQQKILNLQSQSQDYIDALDDTRPILFKLLSVYIRYDSRFFDKKTRQRTGEPLPRLNSDIEVQHEFFSYVSWAQGVTNYYVEGFLKDHLKETNDFIEFLETEYSIEK